MAANPSSEIIEKTISTCLFTNTPFEEFRDDLLSFGWDYPETPLQRAAYWNLTFGKPVGPRKVIHKDSSFPAVSIVSDRTMILTAVYEKNLSQQFDVVLCHLGTSSRRDFDAAASFLNTKATALSTEGGKTLYDFGESSAVLSVSTKNEFAPFAIETVANFPVENEK